MESFLPAGYSNFPVASGAGLNPDLCGNSSRPYRFFSPMRLSFLALGTLLVVLNSTVVNAANSSFAASLGTAGVGIEFNTRLHQKLRLRSVLSGISIPLDGVEEDIDYTGELSTFYAGALLDFHPAANAFRISIGLVLASPEISLESVTSQTNYVIGNSSYSGTLQLDGTASFNPMAPWISLGWASNLHGNGFFWSGEIGFAYIGEPQLELFATGMATDDANPSAGTFDVTNSADFLEQLERERISLEDEYSSFQIAPILNFGIGYRF